MQNPVNAIADLQLAFERLDMNVGGALLDGSLQNQIHQADHGGFGGEVLQVLNICRLITGIVFQIFDQRAHGGSTLAVVTLDQLLDITAQPNRNADRALAGIDQGFYGGVLRWVGHEHMQLAIRCG